MLHLKLLRGTCVMLVIGLSASCAQRQGAAPPPVVDHPKLAAVGTIDGRQEVAAHVREVLARQGIVAYTEGSVVYQVSVAADQREQAIEVLRGDSKEQG